MRENIFLWIQELKDNGQTKAGILKKIYLKQTQGIKELRQPVLK